jgi:hypothetical protein
MAAACGHFFASGECREMAFKRRACGGGYYILLPGHYAPMSFDLYLIRLENGEPVQPDRSAILEVSDWQWYRDQIVGDN